MATMPNVSVTSAILRTVRAFVAHSKSDPAVALAIMREQICKALQREANRRAANIAVEVVLGRDDFLANFARCGSWESWTREVAMGLDYITREPRYHVIVVPHERIGHATEMIVRVALAADRPVIRWNGAGFATVSRVDQVELNNYRTGWAVR